MDAKLVFERQIQPKLRIQDDCWIFTGPTKNGTHGCVKVGGRQGKVLYTHRIAFEAFNRPLTGGEVVMHLCNTARCCNPTHLKAGSQSENIRYAYSCGAVGRQVFNGGRSGIRGVYRSKVAGYTYYIARANKTSKSLYHGKDFFEACCRRKAWEVEHTISETLPNG